MTERRYTVLFEPAEEGGFVVTCPALPGLVTEGDTLDEAREMAKDAIRGHLESLAKDGLPAPDDVRLTQDPVKEEIEVALPQPAGANICLRSSPKTYCALSSEPGFATRT
jgi:predicted RNase H-like HicB family nuclease